MNDLTNRTENGGERKVFLNNFIKLTENDGKQKLFLTILKVNRKARWRK